jgi:glycosyltransferase involved in cell wall biosynthesis
MITKDTPLFSVLVAQYNNGRFLQEAIDSVKAQTYTNWEIVIVDDCSTDNSRDYYKMYENDEQIRIFYNEKNGGEGFAKHNAAAKARGELCGFLDPDDALLPDALQNMVDVHLANPNVAVVFSRMYMCDENLNVTGENRRLVIKQGESYFTNRDYSPEHFVSFKKSFYDKTEGIDGKKRMAADQDMYLKLDEVGDVYVLDKFTLKYRVHPGGLSVGKSMNKAWFWNLIVRYETCIRRGLSVDEYAVQGFLDSLEEREGYLRDGIKGMQSSKAYRLGKFLLKPFRMFRRK